jgi:hypothetical protein
MKDTRIRSWEKNGRTWSLLEVFKEACLKSWSTTQNTPSPYAKIKY